MGRFTEFRVIALEHAVLPTHSTAISICVANELLGNYAGVVPNVAVSTTLESKIKTYLHEHTKSSFCSFFTFYRTLATSCIGDTCVGEIKST